jgi:hypothetical protein
MIWYIFLLNTGEPVLDTVVAPRPESANPPVGGPFTPWFDTEDHWDQRHIHIKADSESAARAKALEIWKRYYV